MHEYAIYIFHEQSLNSQAKMLSTQHRHLPLRRLSLNIYWESVIRTPFEHFFTLTLTFLPYSDIIFPKYLKFLNYYAILFYHKVMVIAMHLIRYGFETS